jgi:hypothetical protein
MGDINQIQIDTEKLWTQVERTLAFYDNHACPCAFPRFRQYASIDCVDTGNSFYVSETEAFISRSSRYFDIQTLTPEQGGECSLAIYTCKKCGSTYEFGWSDFSIHVSRSYLKLKEKKVSDIGSAPLTPIPVFVGPFGHSYPDKAFAKTDLERLTKYLEEIEPVANTV